jgi:hypothetical protein
LRRAAASAEARAGNLERAVFFFKDYPTRMKTAEAFIPCLERGLGPLTTHTW